MLRRRHHCRLCGEIYCAACSSRVTAAEGTGEALRTCEICARKQAGRPMCETCHGLAAAWVSLPRSVSHAVMPLVVFMDSAEDVVTRHIVCPGEVSRGVVDVTPHSKAILDAAYPVAMSPAYLGFVLQPYEVRYMHYDGVGIVFRRPDGGNFMAPSIDTVLACGGLKRLFGALRPDANHTFCSVVDVGCGSGFIGKYCAEHCPGVGAEPLRVTLLDIDPLAIDYVRSASFASPERTRAGRPIEWVAEVGDALAYMEGRTFDLIVANPPYIPTLEEVRCSCCSPCSCSVEEVRCSCCPCSCSAEPDNSHRRL